VQDDPAHDPDPAATRDQMWRHAGLERDATGLRELLECHNPVARMVAGCALAREETRGSHRRTDFPDVDPRLDLRHYVVGVDGSTRLERWE
jgi:L-aspartate oxidase